MRGNNSVTKCKLPSLSTGKKIVGIRNEENQRDKYELLKLRCSLYWYLQQSIHIYFILFYLSMVYVLFKSSQPLPILLAVHVIKFSGIAYIGWFTMCTYYGIPICTKNKCVYDFYRKVFRSKSWPITKKTLMNDPESHREVDEECIVIIKQEEFCLFFELYLSLSLFLLFRPSSWLRPRHSSFQSCYTYTRTN